VNAPDPTSGSASGILASLVFRCTDRGQHSSAVIARADWWSPEVTEWPLSFTGQRGRATRSGGGRETEFGKVTSVKRADGGRTFTLPACQRCTRGPWRLRDDTIEKLRHATPDGVDLSLMP
jgi:hypothetical protein